MAKAPSLTDLTSQYSAQSTVNNNNTKIENAFENTLSRDGSSPNQMEADLDMNSNSILNIDSLTVGSLTVDGVNLVDATAVPDWEGAWVTATSYAKDDLVREDGNVYICLVAHTSGTFATDLSSGKWELFASKGAAGAGTGDLLAANNLSDLDNATTSRSNLAVPGLADNSTITGSWTISSDMTFGDNVKAIFGSGSEFTIECDGTNTTLTEVGSGNLRIRGQNLGLYNEDGSEAYLFCTADAGVTLYYDNTIHARTISGGFRISGDLVIDETADHTTTPVAGRGQFWVRNDTPCTPMFTDDAGNDYTLNTSNNNLTTKEEFTADGTWTKPSGLPSNSVIEIELWGGGGGGDAGGNGGGGGGGAYARVRCLASDLGSTEAVTVGQGGGLAGNGESSSFGSHVTVAGGPRGQDASGVSGGSTVTTTCSAMNYEAGGNGGNRGTDGGDTTYAGAGGGGDAGASGGTSRFGGDGGNHLQNGTSPGGGGGQGASGADGKVVVWIL